MLVDTLASISNQTDTDYDVFVVDDATEDVRQKETIEWWANTAIQVHSKSWRYRINTEKKWALRNQVEAIELLEPDDDDVIVFLDLDGDQLAHPNVLAHLRAAYDSEDLLVTYGNYTPVPFAETCPLAVPFPDHVVRDSTYRQEILARGSHFNHLRTMKGKVFKAIPRDYFFYRGTGEWLDGGTDYAFMVPALELAGGRYKCFGEVLCIYNNANPYADYIMRGAEANRAVLDSLARPPLAPISPGPVL